jgi:copper resistance protein D
MWDMLLVGARFLQFAGASVLLGASLFRMVGFDPTVQSLPGVGIRRGLRRVLVAAALVAIAGTILWVMSEAVLFSGDPADGTDPAGVWLVFSGTRFGRACLWRIGLLVVSIAALVFTSNSRSHQAMQVGLAGAIMATFAWTGHGAATAGAPGLLHRAGDVLHMWAAGAWIGALVPLAMLVVVACRSRSPGDAAAARHGLDRFSAMGTTVIATLVVSGIVNSWFLIGTSQWRLLNQSPYGRVLLIKLGLFASMLMLGAINRIGLAPRLRASLEGALGRPMPALRVLRTSLLMEAGLAVLVLLSVAVLGTLPPPRLGE